MRYATKGDEPVSSTEFEADERARRLISEQTDKNFFVEAGAGSGKTTALVKRMTAMVAKGIPVSSICAITFTKAASMEFYNRFQKSLAKMTVNASEPAVKQRCAEALENIDLCFMGTIDSFANMLIGEFPAEASIPADHTVSPEQEKAEAYNYEYFRIQRGEYGDELKQKASNFRRFYRDPDEVFSQCIMSVMPLRAGKVMNETESITDIDAYLGQERTELIDLLAKLRNYYSDRIDDLPTKGENEHGILLLNKFNIISGTWNDSPGEIINILQKLEGVRIRLSPSEVVGRHEGRFTHHAGKSAKNDWYEMSIEETPVYCRLRELKHMQTVDFLTSSAEAISSELRSRGELTHTDCLIYLRDMLRADASGSGKIINYISRRYSRFLIDEFQDTNPVQAEIFFYLSAIEPCPDWEKCKPRPGSLFIVGDPKQSIYRFQQADVASFLKVRRIFENGAGEVLRLSRNFRSVPQLCSFFNSTFTKLLPADSPDQSRFVPIPFKDESGNLTCISGVFSYKVIVERNSIRSDPGKVIQIIKKLVGDPNITIPDEHTGEPRMLNYRDIMVIACKKAHLRRYIIEFAEAGIPAMVEGDTAFDSCPALKLLTELMSAAAEPTEPLRIYQVLTGRYFGFTEKKLMELVDSGIVLKLYVNEREKLEKHPQAAAAFDMLEKLAYIAREMPPAAAAAKIADDLKIMEYTGAEKPEYFYYAMELLRAAENEGTVTSAASGAEFLRGLISGSGSERCLSLEKDADKVHIANLHKVKGLEAPVVILADPVLAPKKPSHRVEQTAEGMKCWYFRFGSMLENYSETSVYEEAEEKEKVSLLCERIRLMYVAATRAKNVLIIGDSRKTDGSAYDDNPWLPFITEDTEDIFEHFGSACEAAAADDVQREIADISQIYAEAESKSIFNDETPKSSTYLIIRPSRISVKRHDRPAEMPTDRENEAVPRTDAALVGTMVHRLMECVVSSGGNTGITGLVSSILDSFGVSDEKYAKLLSGVLETLSNGGFPQKNGAVQDILSELADAEQTGCEVPFSYRKDLEGGSFEIYHGIIDLVYKKSGKWHIIDYKTNAETTGLDDRYEDQLEAYKSAFYAITGEKADAFIYHIDV